jgi:hypothetical protein
VTIARANTTSRNVPLENSVGAGLLSVGSGTSRGYLGQAGTALSGMSKHTPRPGFRVGAKIGSCRRGEWARCLWPRASRCTWTINRRCRRPRRRSNVRLRNGYSRRWPARNFDQRAWGVLESRSKAQLWLIRLRMKDPTSLATTTANELLATAWP